FATRGRSRRAGRLRLCTRGAGTASLLAERRDDRLRDDLERPPRDLRRLAEPRERAGLRQSFLFHQQALRALDRLARGECFRERLGLLAQRRELLMPRARRVDRRQEIALAKRLHEVAEHAGLDRTRDEF